jgi:hypothetical protein
MAGSEQRPTDDVEGHGKRYPVEETTGDDRGTRYPDDTEGHSYRGWQDTEAIEDDPGSRLSDDVEGHIKRIGQDTEAADEDQAGDDTQGNIRRY